MEPSIILKVNIILKKHYSKNEVKQINDAKHVSWNGWVSLSFFLLAIMCLSLTCYLTYDMISVNVELFGWLT